MRASLSSLTPPQIRKKHRLTQPFIAIATAAVMKGNVALTGTQYHGGLNVYPETSEDIEHKLNVLLDENHSHYVLVDKTESDYGFAVNKAHSTRQWSPIIPGVQNVDDPKVSTRREENTRQYLCLFVHSICVSLFTVYVALCSQYSWLTFVPSPPPSTPTAAPSSPSGPRSAPATPLRT